MNLRRYAGALVVCGLMILPPASRAEMLEINHMTSGFVQSAGGGAVTIVGQPSGVPSQIRLDGETQYQGVDKAEDLQPGDRVKIEYKQKGDTKTAMVVTRG